MNLRTILHNAVIWAVAKFWKSRRSYDFLLLQDLESRVLLANFTFTDGSGVDHKWSTLSNWEDSLGHIPGALPTTGDNIIFNASATVIMDTDYGATNKLGSFTVNAQAGANVDVTLNFDHNNAEMKLTSGFSLNQTATHAASLAFSTNSPTNNATVTASGLTSDGNAGGWSNLSVNAHVALDLSNDLYTRDHLTQITVAGSLSADNFYAEGKNTTDIQSIVVTGTLTIAHELRVGGNGATNFTANSSITVGTIASPGTVNLGYYSEIFVTSNATFTIHGNVNVGEFTGSSFSSSGGAILAC